MEPTTTDVAAAGLPRYRCHKEVWAVKIREIQRVDPREFKGACCKGSLVLGSGCGLCERCVYERQHGPWKSEYLIVPEDWGYSPIPVASSWMAKHQPQVGGYYVVYKDGYKSFSPAQAFEEGYTRI